MNDKAVVEGDYVDLRFIKSRKVAQVVVEIAIEKAAGFVASFGTPNPATTISVAVVRLVEEGGRPQKEKQRWSEMEPSKQAAIRCNEPEFQKYMNAAGPDEAAQYVRQQCRVQSRSEFNTNPAAAARWQALETDYFAWQRGGIR